jgi:L,D-peptidoglycan transpeptidase YkuD (ErfK/YbiS/YcfS/YnhG family)
MYWLVFGILITTANLAAMASMNPPAQGRQLIIVSAESWRSETGKLQMVSNVSGRWVRHGNDIAVVLGRGLGWGRGLHRDSKAGPQKREGDQRAPAGIFLISPVFGYSEKPPAGCRLPYRAITGQDYFVDDPKAKEYNQWVRLPRDRTPKQVWHSAEKMLRPDRLYELGIVIHHNMHPVIPGRGSAIFFHVWRSASTPTVGCTAMAKKDLLALIKWLDPAKKPLLIQAPAAELAELRAQARTAPRDAQN